MAEGLNLEIGSRYNPSDKYLRDDLLPKGKIICIDKRVGWFTGYKNLLRGYGLLAADGQNLPITDNSVDFICAKDLFGADGQRAITPAEKMDFENIGDNLPKEWFRICKPSAKIVVIEVSTPAPRENLIKQFKEAGFELVEDHVGKDVYSVFKEDIKPFFNQDAYSLVLRKT